MKNKLFAALITLSFIAHPTFVWGQSFPPYENKKTWWVAPLALTGTALVIGTEKFKAGELKFHDKNFANFHTSIEDVMTHIPNLVYLGANLRYDKKTAIEATKILLTANLFNFIGTHGLKFFSQIERPNGANFKSFPSGHTSMAFVGAHLIAKEFGKGDPLISIAAYGFATTTGLLRWANKDHWISDIAGGAAMGIFATEMAIRHLPKILEAIDKNGRLSYEPMIFQKGAGLALRYQL